MEIRKIAKEIVIDLLKRTDNDRKYIDVIGRILGKDEEMIKAYYDYLQKHPKVEKWELLFQAMEIRHRIH